MNLLQKLIRAFKTSDHLNPCAAEQREMEAYKARKAEREELGPRFGPPELVDMRAQAVGEWRLRQAQKYDYPAFLRICKARGLDPNAIGEPPACTTNDFRDWKMPHERGEGLSNTGQPVMA